MASSSTALSKTAINTLRGVLFTTSFSVVLLAEERRRRIKIARAAVDNARKLHAAKASHNAEGYAVIEQFDLEARLANLEGSSLIAQPSSHDKAHRRAKRKAIEKPNVADTPPHTIASTASKPAPSIRNIHHDSTALDHIAEIMATGRKTTEPPTSRRSAAKSIPLRINIAKNAAGSNALTQESGKAAAISLDIMSAQLDTEKIAAPLSDYLEYENIMVTAQDRKDASASYNTAVAALITAANALPTRPNIAEAPSHAFQTALQTLREVGTHKKTQSSHRAIVQDIVVDLLVYSSGLTAHNMIEVLEASQFMGKSIISVLHRFLTWMDEYHPEGATETLQNILPFFESPEKIQMLGGHVAQKLVQAKRTRCNRLAIKQYDALKAAGLFTQIQTPQYEYDIRREAIIAACAVGQAHMVDEEMAALRQLKGRDVETDFRVQAALMIQQVVLGDSDGVFDSLRDLEKYAGSPREFRKHIGHVTELLVKSYGVEELGDWLKRAAETYGLVLETKWAFPVLNGYAYHHDIEGMMVWLEFCLNHGLKMDYDFAVAWKRTCRGYLRFNEDETRMLWTRMIKFMLPTHMTGRDYQAQSHKSGLKSRMAELTKSGLWDKACLVFDAALIKSREICDVSLTMALHAQVRANKGYAKPALQLLERVRDYGKDTAIAQEQFLRKEIENRHDSDIKALLFLAAEHGCEIPAKVYTLAAEKVMGRDLHTAHDILQLGVRQLSHGKLAFNGECFAKLLYINIALRRYDAVHSLVSYFVSGREVWHGTMVCKESMKFAIRELAKRSAVAADNGDHGQSDYGLRNTELRLMEELQQALEHNMDSRMEMGYHQTIADSIILLVEEVANRKDVSVALKSQWNKEAAKKGAKRVAKSQRDGPTLRRDRIAHISVDA